MSRPPTFNLSTFLEKDKLKTDGTNFTAWFRNLRILLVPYKLTYVIEAKIPSKPADSASHDEKNVWQSKADDFSLIQSGMLYAMEPELQKCFEKMNAFEIIEDLKSIFAP